MGASLVVLIYRYSRSTLIARSSPFLSQHNVQCDMIDETPISILHAFRYNYTTQSRSKKKKSGRQEISPVVSKYCQASALYNLLRPWVVFEGVYIPTVFVSNVTPADTLILLGSDPDFGPEIWWWLRTPERPKLPSQ